MSGVEFERLVDAKISPGNMSGLTGKSLFIFLVAALTLISIGLDWISGHLSLDGLGLTVPFVSAVLVTWGVGTWAVPQLRALKAGQIIREDGPQAHLKKAGTPTMGGVFVVPVGVAIALLFAGLTSEVVAVSVLTLSYGLIGWLDDWQILRRKSNKGISPRLKLMLQVSFGAVFCIWLFFHQSVELTTLLAPFGLSLPLGLLFWFVSWFVLVAESNATNLTDGLDGLAAGTGAIALFGLGALITTAHPGLAIFCVCLSGSYLGFLAHNHNPARVFMGDTGSLALGGALAGAAILSQSLVALLILSGIFLVETLSVIAQVGYFKATKDENGIGKRLFKMAPLHHHLELTGWSETQIVARFYLIGAVLALFALLSFQGWSNG